MKNNKVLTILSIIIIIAIVAVLVVLGYQFIKSSIETGNGVNNDSNQLTNDNNNIQANSETNGQENTDTNIVNPVLNEITSNENNNGQVTEPFTSTYYYSQLNETAKIIYDGLKENKSKLISGNYTIDYSTKFNTLLHTEKGEETLNQAFQSAWDAFSYDHIDLFYIDVTKMSLTNEYQSIGGIATYKIKIGPGNNANYFQPEFKDQKDVEDAQYYLEDIKKQIIGQTTTNSTYLKVKRVHDWMISFMEYDNSTTASRSKYSIYGALKNRKAVCEGYARTFKYIMDGIGVPCVLVSGTAKNSEGTTESHAWNYVQLNERWYGVDVTWDDPIITGGGELTNDAKYRYFLKGSEEFSKDRKENGQISEKSMKFKFPSLFLQNYTD